MPAYLSNIAISFDQLLNTFLGGSPDETLSARAHRMRVKGHKHWKWTADAIDKLFFWQSTHCLSAFNAEISRRQFPSSYQKVP